MFQYNLFNPALMLVYALGYFKGPDHMVIYLVYIQILQILAAGAAGYLFLSQFQISEKSKVLGAYLYGMNGFLLVWGQHYQFGMASVYLPLVLVMAERSFRAGKAKAGLPVMVCLMVFSSTYFSYMSCLAVGVYLLFRAAYEEGDWKQKIWVLVRIYAGMLLWNCHGAVCAAAFPVCHYRTQWTDRDRASSVETAVKRLSPFKAFLLPDSSVSVLFRKPAERPVHGLVGLCQLL